MNRPKSTLPSILINPLCTALTPSSLVRSEGTYICFFYKAMLDMEWCYFQVLDKGFCFILGVHDRKLFFQRNKHVIFIDAEAITKIEGVDSIHITWNHDRLTMSCVNATNLEGVYRSLRLDPAPTPISLFRYVRRESLIPVVQYKTEADFLHRVNECLFSLEHKLSEIENVSGFWDISYEGNRIISRIPKREVDLHSIVQAILSDQMFLSSIDVHPEAQTGVGKLDYLLTASVQNEGIVKYCVEFKHLHSKDLFHGIEVQLPRYMKSLGVRHGGYCVFDFRCKWFEDHSFSEADEEWLLFRSPFRARKFASDIGIKVFMYEMGKHVDASKG